MGLRGKVQQRNIQPIRTADYRAIPSGISTQFVETLQTAVGEKRRAEENEIKRQVDFASALFENDADIERIRAEQELSNQEGLNALEQEASIRQQYVTNLRNRFAQIPEQYRNDPTYAPQLQLSLYKKAGQFDKFSIPYVNSESRKIEQKAFDSRVANDVNIAVENANDLNYLEASGIPQVESSLYKKLSREYGSDPNRVIGNRTVGEIIMDEMGAGVSNTITRSIEQQVLVDRFDLASLTVQKFQDRITPDDRIKIKKMIESGLDRRKNDRALSLANQTLQVLGPGADLVRIQKHLMAAAGNDSDLYTKSLSILQGRQQIFDAQKKRNWENIEADTYEALVSGGNYDPARLSELPPDRQVKLLDLVSKNRGRRPVVTDYDQYNRISNEIELMPREEFAQLNIDKMYGRYLNAEDLTTLEIRQRQVRKELSGEAAAGQRWSPSVYKEAAFSYIKARGIRKNQQSKIYTLAENEYARLIDESPRITRTELTRKVKKALFERGQIEVEKPRTFFGFEIPFTSKTVTETAETLAPKRPQAIHPDWIKATQQNNLRRGRKQMNESELMDFFKHLKDEQPDTNLSLPPQ